MLITNAARYTASGMPEGMGGGRRFCTPQWILHLGMLWGFGLGGVWVGMSASRFLLLLLLLPLLLLLLLLFVGLQPPAFEVAVGCS